MSKQILVSGIKPTGDLHLGNYFGAIKQFVEMQKNKGFDSFVFLADYHALNSVQNREEMKKLSFDLICAYIACGLDPKKIVLYRQSQIPEHAELTWIFNTLVTMPWLMRAHAFKDAEAKDKDINIGTFDYPVLMAADILMYNADVVPVGKDQIQHIEMAREIARKFNQTFGEVFKEPKEIVKEEVATVLGIDGQKMSKSYKNVIPLFGSEEDVKKAVMGIVTDSKGKDDAKNPEEVVVYQIYKLLADEAERKVMEEGLRNGGLGYGEAKQILLNKVLAYFGAMKKKYDELQKKPKKIYAILEKGEKKARKIAQKKMLEVKKLVGLI
ncbi:MAG: Tryptophan--tRNA ligase [Patescibacteria group bacterium]|jgi:tryptophanyl-tRNA synthetase|nr:Tryptophan--tRNA ligase [Patescibacteria group bacterium]